MCDYCSKDLVQFNIGTKTVQFYIGTKTEVQFYIETKTEVQFIETKSKEGNMCKQNASSRVRSIDPILRFINDKFATGFCRCPYYIKTTASDQLFEVKQRPSQLVFG